MAGKKSQTTIDREQFILDSYEKDGETSSRGYAYRCLQAKLIPTMSDKHNYWVDEVVGKFLRDARISGRLPWDAVIESRRGLHGDIEPGVGTITTPDVASYIRAAGYDVERNIFEGQPHRLLLICEKDTIWPWVEEAIAGLPVKHLVTNGFTSWTAAKKVACWSWQEEQPVIIFMVVDFDPSGMYMVDIDWPNRLHTLGANIAVVTNAAGAPITEVVPVPFTKTRKGEPAEMIERPVFDIRHLAITMDQVRQFDIEALLLPAADKSGDAVKYAHFVARYGDRFIELDAMNRTQMRTAVREPLLPLVDLARRDAIQARAAEEQRAMQATLEVLAQRLADDGTLAQLAEEHERIISEDFAHLTDDLDPPYPPEEPFSE